MLGSGGGGGGQGACHQAIQPHLVWVSLSRTGIKGQVGRPRHLGASPWPSNLKQWVRLAVRGGLSLSSPLGPLLPSPSPLPPNTPSLELPSLPPCSGLCVCLVTRINVATNNAAGWVLICQTQCTAVIPNTLTFSHEIISIFSD